MKKIDNNVIIYITIKILFGTGGDYMLKISQELKEKGYSFKYDGNRVDIFQEGNKIYEIFFFNNEVLIMNETEYEWVKRILFVELLDSGLCVAAYK